jgi:hypothetical protein
MQYSPSWVANSSSASQEIPYTAWNTNGHNSPPLAPILSQMYPLYTLLSQLFKTFFILLSQLLWLITIIISGKAYKSWSFLLCNFLQPPATYSLSGSECLTPLAESLPSVWDIKFHIYTKQEANYSLVHFSIYVFR